MTNLTKTQVTFINQVAQSVLANAFVTENPQPVARKLWASDVDPLLIACIVRNLASGKKPVVVVPKESTKAARPGWSRITFEEAKARVYLQRIRAKFERLCGYTMQASAAHTDPVLRVAKMLAKLTAAQRARAERMAEKIAAE